MAERFLLYFPQTGRHGYGQVVRLIKFARSKSAELVLFPERSEESPHVPILKHERIIKRSQDSLAKFVEHCEALGGTPQDIVRLTYKLKDFETIETDELSDVRRAPELYLIDFNKKQLMTPTLPDELSKNQVSPQAISEPGQIIYKSLVEDEDTRFLDAELKKDEAIAYIQLSETDACMDFWCDCDEEGGGNHIDGKNFNFIHCESCYGVYSPSQILRGRSYSDMPHYGEKAEIEAAQSDIFDRMYSAFNAPATEEASAAFQWKGTALYASYRCYCSHEGVIDDDEIQFGQFHCNGCKRLLFFDSRLKMIKVPDNHLEAISIDDIY